MPHFKMGRPMKYNNCMDFDAMCELYFEQCDEGREVEVYDKTRQTVVKMKQSIPYTVPGLAVSLGFCDKQSLIDYAEREEFSFTVKKAKARIEQQRNENMLTGDTVAATSIFDLKNNFGWTDRSQEREIVEDHIQKVQIEVVNGK